MSDLSSSSVCCDAQSSVCSQASVESAAGAKRPVFEAAEPEPTRPTIMDSAILVAAAPALSATLNHLPVTRNSSSGSSNSGEAGSSAKARSTQSSRGPTAGRDPRPRQVGSSNLHFNSTDISHEPQMIRYLGSSSQVRSEQKATKVLGVVFFTFVICWTPFFVINFTQAFVDRAQLARWISNEMMTTFLWLGYISSTINPVIYTVFNRNFRRAFRHLITCQSGHHRYSSRSLRINSINKSFRFGQHTHHRNSSNQGHSLQTATHTHSNGLPSNNKLNLSTGYDRKNKLEQHSGVSAGCETMLMLDESQALSNA